MTPNTQGPPVVIGSCYGDGQPGVYVWIDPAVLAPNGKFVQLLIGVDDARALAAELELAARGGEQLRDGHRLDVADPSEPGYWVVSGYEETMTRLKDGSLRPEAVTAHLLGEFSQLATLVSRCVDAAVAQRASELLGATVAHAVAEGVGEDMGELLLEDTLDDLQAAVRPLHFTTKHLARQTARVAAMLADLAAEDPAVVADGEHYGDLFMAVAMAWECANVAATQGQ